MRLLIFIFFLPAFLHAQTVSVSIDSLMAHVSYFSSPALSGRLPGTKGFLDAINYSENYFINHGLVKINNHEWQQVISIETNVIDSADVIIYSENGSDKLIPGVDFSVRGYSGSGNVKAPVVFCGYGVDSDNYSDFSDIDVKDKVVMVFKSNPPFLKDVLPEYSIRRVSDNAYRHGAKAVIFVSQPNQKFPQKPIGSMMHGAGVMHEDLPQIQLSVEKAELLLQGTGYTLKELQSDIDLHKKPKSVSCSNQISVFVEATYNKNGSTNNLIAMLPGNDAKLKNEFVIICAHIDHVGSIGKTVYYPGANDNASGSAAVLELARIFSSEKENLKRSVLFVLFGSEEKGLDGSEYFVNNLPMPKKDIYAVFNIDCIGCGDSLMAGNGLSSPDLWNLSIDIAKQNNWQVSKNTWGGGGADLKPFYQAGINGLYFVNTNAHQNLHLPSDNIDIINKTQYARTVEWIEKITRSIAIE